MKTRRKNKYLPQDTGFTLVVPPAALVLVSKAPLRHSKRRVTWRLAQ